MTAWPRASEGRVPVCIFAKPPVPGEAKTRLAREVGFVEAARLARAFLHDTWATVSTLPWARPILATTTSDLIPFGLGDDLVVWPQGPGDLGNRLERILARGVAEAGQALVIGADIPGLPQGHLDVARHVLESHDVVLGPTEDGGFYLIGASRHLPVGALSDIPWSCEDTLTKTEERLMRAGLSLARAPSWFDVDEPADLVRARQMLAHNPMAAPRTRQALAREAS